MSDSRLDSPRGARYGITLAGFESHRHAAQVAKGLPVTDVSQDPSDRWNKAREKFRTVCTLTELEFLYDTLDNLVARARTANLSLAIQNRAAELRIWAAYAAGRKLQTSWVETPDRSSASQASALMQERSKSFVARAWHSCADHPFVVLQPPQVAALRTAT
jgi:hypothetical protein